MLDSARRPTGPFGFRVAALCAAAIIFGASTCEARSLATAEINLASLVQYELGEGGYLFVGDFNGDGIIDLGQVDRRPFVALGKGDGTFVEPALKSGGDGSEPAVPRPVVADFDGDGKLDIAVATSRPLIATEPQPTTLPPPAVAVYRGNGEGTFAAPIVTPIGQPPSDDAGDRAIGLVAGNFTGSGRTDLAVLLTVIPKQGDPLHTEVRVLRNLGPLGFSAPIATQVGPNSSSPPVAGDFDGDGSTDIAVDAIGSGGPSVLLLRASGDGHFSEPAELCTRCTAGAAADVNGDGKLDLVSDAGKPGILFGHGDGSFAATNAPPQITLPAPPIAVADLNGDRLPDLAAASYGAALFPGQGDAFDAPHYYAAHWGVPDVPFDREARFVPDILIADLNRDGRPDVLVASGSRASILMNVPAASEACSNRRTFNAGPGGIMGGSAAGDLIRGTFGMNVIDGGAGADCLYGDGDGVRVFGGAQGGPSDGSRPPDQSDILRGGPGDDKLFGVQGNDRLFGGPGADLLVGGPGDDKLIGGPGPDRIFGGAGNDLIDARDGGPDFVNCGSGRDTVRADRIDHLVHCERVVIGRPRSRGRSVG